MLTPARDLEPDALDRVRRWGLFGAPIAECTETGMRLRINKTQRTPDKPPRYIITAPCQAGHAKIWYVEAYTDEEAIEKANTWLERRQHTDGAPVEQPSFQGDTYAEPHRSPGP